MEKALKNLPKRCKRFWSWLGRKLACDPGITFFRLWIVRISILVVAGIAGYFSYLIKRDYSLSLDLSANGLEVFWESFRLPIYVVGLLVPILAVIGANHRSAQTLEAMRLATSQNNFANYFKHREEFVKHVKDLNLNFKIDNQELHSALFSHAEAGDLKFNEEFMDILRTVLDKVNGCLGRVGEATCELTDNEFIALSMNLKEQISAYVRMKLDPRAPYSPLLSVLPLYERGRNVYYDQTMLMRNFTEANELLDMLNSYKRICEFSYSNYRDELKAHFEIMDISLRQIHTNPRLPYFDGQFVLS